MGDVTFFSDLFEALIVIHYVNGGFLEIQNVWTRKLQLDETIA